MNTTPDSQRRLALVKEHYPALLAILARYGAANPRLFGSVARGDAGEHSDIDVLVDLAPGAGNPLLRVAGIAEEFSRALGLPVDVAAEELLREGVSSAAKSQAVPLEP
jgi:predicted nucleotidyltransferase